MLKNLNSGNIKAGLYCQSGLYIQHATSFIHLPGNKRIPQRKQSDCFETIHNHQDNFWFLYKSWTTSQKKWTVWSKINGSLKEQHPANTAGGTTHSGEVLLKFSWLVLQHVGEHLVGRYGCNQIWTVAIALDNQRWLSQASINHLEARTSRIRRKIRQCCFLTWQCLATWSKTCQGNSRTAISRTWKLSTFYCSPRHKNLQNTAITQSFMYKILNFARKWVKHARTAISTPALFRTHV